MSAIARKIVDDGSRRLHIERIGYPANAASDLPLRELLPLIAVAQAYAGAPIAAAKEDPTPEEMLAIGMALGMYEADRARRQQPPFSAWRLSARLGM